MTLAEKIRIILQDLGETSIVQIAELLKEERNVVERALHRQLRNHEVVRVSRGVYAPKERKEADTIVAHSNVQKIWRIAKIQKGTYCAEDITLIVEIEPLIVEYILNALVKKDFVKLVSETPEGKVYRTVSRAKEQRECPFDTEQSKYRKQIAEIYQLFFSPSKEQEEQIIQERIADLYHSYCVQP